MKDTNHEKELVSVKPEDPTEVMEPSPPPQEVPPAPDMDPRLGDKTPAYMEWLAKFYPDQFKKRYAGRQVLGTRMPVVISEPRMPAQSKPIAPIGSDVPEDAMAHEKKEVWL